MNIAITTPATDCSGAHPVLPEQLSWSWADWVEHYGGDFADLMGDAYAVSVIQASDPDTCRLSPRALEHLLQAHGFSTALLAVDAHPLLPLEHAGQALAWLGY